MRQQIIEIDPILDSLLRYCLKEAMEKIEKKESLVPFTGIVVKNKLFMEQHAQENEEEVRSSVRLCVGGVRGAEAYGFCYYGYIDTEDEGEIVQKDCLIAEGGIPGDEKGHAVGIVYSQDGEENISFDEHLVYVGEVENFMSHLDPIIPKEVIEDLGIKVHKNKE